MSKTFETVIKNFSGLSSEIKPTIAAGNNIPNGSRWREVDKNRTAFFDLESDKWYHFDPSSGEAVIEGNAKKQLVQDNNAESLLTGILKEQKKTNLYLAIMNDIVIDNEEVS